MKGHIANKNNFSMTQSLSKKLLLTAFTLWHFFGFLFQYYVFNRLVSLQIFFSYVRGD